MNCPKCGREHTAIGYTHTPDDHWCRGNQIENLKNEVLRLHKIILDDYKAKCDRFYDDPNNSGLPLPKNPLED